MQITLNPISMSINKIVLKHSHAPFTYYVWLLSCYSDRAKYLKQRLYDVQSQKHLLSGPL